MKKNVVHRIVNSRYMHGIIEIFDYEEDIFFYLALLLSSEGIADKIKWPNAHCVDNAIQELFEKTGVIKIENECRKRYQLVLWAEEHGVLIKENRVWIRGSERK